MLFNSLAFAIFFPITALLYFVLPSKWKVPFLLLSSCVFYCAYIPAYILILLVIIVFDFAAAKMIEQQKSESAKSLLLFLSIVANVAFLGIFKYYNFISTNMAHLATFIGVHVQPSHFGWPLPIGLSFHTFQSMSYTIEVRKGAQKAESNFLVYALYVLFFPQLVAGPIERPQHMLPQLHKVSQVKFDRARVVRGLQLMLWGFIKKIVIADNLAILVDTVYSRQGEHSGSILLVSAIAFTIQLYCDFSGYTDIAIGAAEVLGVTLMENFRRPLFAPNILEFWQRWHISLTTWLRDYVFYPLFFNTKRLYTSTFLVFLVSGLWHGANWTFVVWGALHGIGMTIYLVCNKYRPPKSKVKIGWVQMIAGVIATFLFVTFAAIFFRSPSVTVALFIVQRIFVDPVQLLIGQTVLLEADQTWLIMHANDLFWCVVLTSAFFAVELLQGKISLRTGTANYPRPVRWALYYAALACILIFGRFNSSPFLYFQF